MRHPTAPVRLALARSAVARAACAGLAALTLVACAAATPAPSITPVPQLGSFTPRVAAAPSPTPTDIASTEIPDEPKTTNAVALTRPNRGSGAPVGAVVFGADVTESTRIVSVSGERTNFTAGRQVAWRVTLPPATGGESVRVTLTTDDDTETLVDEFIAQSGWNVYFGKSLLTVAAGTYVLHYLVDGHEVGSGTFKIRPAEPQVPGPSAAATDEATD